tara:strand:+ start:1111 stop:1803 length:693 start_codon:yes stop_codon:yes gene_type:complete
MQRTYYFLLKIILSPFLILEKLTGFRIYLLKYLPDSIPIPSFALASLRELADNIRKAKSNKHTSKYPAYFLLSEVIGSKFDASYTNKGSFVDPLGNIYSYDHSDNNLYQHYKESCSDWKSFKNSFDDSENLYYPFCSLEITRKDLLFNLNKCKKEEIKHDNININLEKIIRDVIRFGYDGGLFIYDAPTYYRSILIYDETKDVYKRVALDGEVTSYSWHISKVADRFPIV